MGIFPIGASDSSNDARRGVSGLFLLFPPGRRPGQAEVRACSRSFPELLVTLDLGGERPSSFDGPAFPDTAETPIRPAILGVEILRQGLTFDLDGLAPGPSLPFPAVNHCFDFPQLPAQGAYEAVWLIPGRHLSGGERTMPVLRGMIALARELAAHFDELAGVIWSPSRSVIGRRFFESTMAAWLDGGAFPALGLTAFAESQGGGLQSVGLAHFIGQEIVLDPALAQDRVAATRLGLRLVNQLVLSGGIDGPEQVVGPDGTPLILRVSADGGTIEVARA